VIRTSDDLKKQAALPLLGIIPDMPAGAARVLPLSPKQSAPQAFFLAHYQPFRDAVDLIYKTIQLTSGQPLSSLMVTSAVAGEGKTTLAIGLALTAARLHQRVLLIDMDLRNPSLHKQLNLSNDQGLSSYINAGQTRFSPASITLAGTAIDVMPAGPVQDDPVRLLSSRTAQQLLAHAETQYDLVILDTPVVLGSADVLQLSSLCKAGVMISRLERVTQDDLTEAMLMLSAVNMVGIVANKYQDGHKPDVRRNSDNSSATPPTGNLSFGSSMAQFVANGPIWKRLFTVSSVGAGMVASASLMQEQLSDTQPTPPTPTPPAARTKGEAAAQSPSQPSPSSQFNAALTNDGVTALHLPQWS
ncbi:MAG: CpsD/CapB family tyrosine-protein kinase, partial [Elainellaceae cyanobacterium]